MAEAVKKRTLGDQGEALASDSVTSSEYLSNSKKSLLDKRETRTSTTPASDTARKQAKMQDTTAYPDANIKQRAEDGDYDARQEADRRKVQWTRR